MGRKRQALSGLAHSSCFFQCLDGEPKDLVGDAKPRLDPLEKDAVLGGLLFLRLLNVGLNFLFEAVEAFLGYQVKRREGQDLNLALRLQSFTPVEKPLLGQVAELHDLPLVKTARSLFPAERSEHIHFVPGKGQEQIPIRLLLGLSLLGQARVEDRPPPDSVPPLSIQDGEGILPLDRQRTAGRRPQEKAPAPGLGSGAINMERGRRFLFGDEKDGLGRKRRFDFFERHGSFKRESPHRLSPLPSDFGRRVIRRRSGSTAARTTVTRWPMAKRLPDLRPTRSCLDRR
jgi:hypothetical protein